MRHAPFTIGDPLPGARSLVGPAAANDLRPAGGFWALLDIFHLLRRAGPRLALRRHHGRPLAGHPLRFRAVCADHRPVSICALADSSGPRLAANRLCGLRRVPLRAPARSGIRNDSSRAPDARRRAPPPATQPDAGDHWLRDSIASVVGAQRGARGAGDGITRLRRAAAAHVLPSDDTRPNRPVFHNRMLAGFWPDLRFEVPLT